GFGGYRLYGTYTSSKREAAWQELAQTSSPEGLAQVAEQHSIKAVRMLALLRAADLHLERAIFVGEPGGGPEQGEDDGDENDGDENGDASAVRAVQPAETAEQKQRLERAETMYQRVLEEAEAAEFRVNAMLGLAAVAESREQWDAAVDWYTQAEALGEQSQLPRIVSIADHRRNLLDKLRLPVAIVEAPEPEESAGGAGTGAGEGEVGQGAIDELIDVPNLLERPSDETVTDPADDSEAGPVDESDAADDTAGEGFSQEVFPEEGGE
ncbi:MAG: hypothetical protein ACOC3G_01150, partial [Phycisphaeraceae bacterium]